MPQFASLVFWGLCCALTFGDVTNWQTGETIPGTEGLTIKELSSASWNTEAMNLRFADLDAIHLYQGELQLPNAWLDHARFRNANLDGAHLSGANLSRANLARVSDSDLSGTDLSYVEFSELKNVTVDAAIVRGADFTSRRERGFTPELLSSTWSYQAKDLREVRFSDNDLSGGISAARTSRVRHGMNSGRLCGAEHVLDIPRCDLDER